MKGDGYGDGSGDGYGDGNGDGYGDGYGDGDGGYPHLVSIYEVDDLRLHAASTLAVTQIIS